MIRAEFEAELLREGYEIREGGIRLSPTNTVRRTPTG